MDVGRKHHAAMRLPCRERSDRRSSVPRYPHVVLAGMEHHGDGTPGTTIFVPVEDIDALQRELAVKNYSTPNPASMNCPGTARSSLRTRLATASGFANRQAADGCAGGGSLPC